uniref:Charged multivesicular body protein 5 n=1 Tax=Aegilops tauschii subsp. strangulata TaxID=200361 RepID=A0A452ZFX3_AEGTS
SIPFSWNPWLAGWIGADIQAGGHVDEKIKKLDAELARYKEQIKKTRPGPAQESVKARAMRILKQRKMDLLSNLMRGTIPVSFGSLTHLRQNGSSAMKQLCFLFSTLL